MPMLSNDYQVLLRLLLNYYFDSIIIFKELLIDYCRGRGDTERGRGRERERELIIYPRLDNLEFSSSGEIIILVLMLDMISQLLTCQRPYHLIGNFLCSRKEC